MLESMIEEPIPTRAEASDVANAIIVGTDAIMLSGETAVGKYPLGAVNMMKKIAQNIEKNNYFVHNVVLEKCGEFYEQDSLAIVSAVVNMLSEAHTDAIITLTKTGYTAKLLSKAKPDVPIVAISDNESVCRRMALFWGVFPYFVGTEFEDTFTEGMIKKIDELLMRDTFLEKGDSTIIVGSLPGWASVRANFLRIHQIGSVGII
jgi:pyruvate kinase